ncbi:MAG: hypothetical protein E6J34_02270 [Chloroflexi bacterium]|nr:MAG: hypothetical protein E6J34_02270 [Chloroflexota bacterium]
MQEAQNWRELLAIIINDPREKSRITEALGVTPITIARWVSGESEPRLQNLRQLLAILPQYRSQFLELLKKERDIKEFISSLLQDSEKDIPSEFYVQIFAARASTSESLRFWSTCNLILQQAIGQLDPNRQGLSVWIASCMPLSGPYKKVRSLREMVGAGTTPWPGDLGRLGMFLGAESLAGNVVTLCRPTVLQDLETEQPNTAYVPDEHEISSVAYPILFAGNIAGVLLVSSTQKNYFTVARTSLIQRYADLIALLFEPEAFYAPSQIALHVMPKREEQKRHFAQFRYLIANTLMDAASRNEPKNPVEANLLVWQKLESELLQSVSGLS